MCPPVSDIVYYVRAGIFMARIRSHGSVASGVGFDYMDLLLRYFLEYNRAYGIR